MGTTPKNSPGSGQRSGPGSGPLNGRKAQANRNDQAILDAARAVFVRDPGAPISAVAKEAGVGISALYRRYSGKEELLQTLCADGLTTYIACAERALADEEDPWRAFTAFLRDIVDADVHGLTVNLAGTFTPTEAMFHQSVRASGLAGQLLDRAQAAGAVRPDLDLNDLAMLLEQLTAIGAGDPERTAVLRRRYLAMHFDALRPEAASGPLPGPPPSDMELGARWIPRDSTKS